jgi:hypothetical protein
MMEFNCAIGADSCEAWKAVIGNNERLMNKNAPKEKLPNSVVEKVGQELNTLFDKKHGKENQAVY